MSNRTPATEAAAPRASKADTVSNLLREPTGATLENSQSANGKPPNVGECLILGWKAEVIFLRASGPADIFRPTNPIKRPNSAKGLRNKNPKRL